MLEHTRGRTQRTSAVIFINGNYELTRPLLPKLLSRRASRGARVHLVLSQNASVDAFCASTSVPVASVVRVPSVNAFPSAYEAHRGGWTRYRTGDIVLLLCGPLGRLLAVEWFLQQPSATFLELGSFFDPELHSGKSLGLKWEPRPSTMAGNGGRSVSKGATSKPIARCSALLSRACCKPLLNAKPQGRRREIDHRSCQRRWVGEGVCSKTLAHMREGHKQHTSAHRTHTSAHRTPPPPQTVQTGRAGEAAPARVCIITPAAR